MILDDIPCAWYETFYRDRVLVKVCNEMGDCQGFFCWLAEQAPELYNRINASENEIDSLWLNRSDKESFKAACKSWYGLLMEAKKGFDAWKVKQMEESRQPAQKAMALG
jgi:hypothetical protein